MPTTLITGANRGLGLEFARQYLADGWHVYAACRDPASASELHRPADENHDTLRILAMDVTEPGSIDAAATELDGQAIDLLLNNSGIIGPRGQTIGNIDYDAWKEVLDVNALGPMRVSEAFIEHVARSDRKLIVTLTSGMGSIADNTSGGSILYRSSKSAVLHRTSNCEAKALHRNSYRLLYSLDIKGLIRRTDTRRFSRSGSSVWIFRNCSP